MHDVIPTETRAQEGRSGPATSWPRSIAIAVGGGLFVGALTSVGQGALPDEVRSLANGSAPWSAAAFVLAAVAGRRETFRSAVLAAGALLAMLAGYSVTATMRGFPISGSTTLFWVAAAFIAGPVLGVGAAWSLGTDRRKAAVGVALLASILVGEAIYGLTVIADSTSPAYWTAQLIVGLGLVALLGHHLRSWTALVLCSALTAAGAAAFALLYSRLTGLA